MQPSNILDALLLKFHSSFVYSSLFFYFFTVFKGKSDGPEQILCFEVSSFFFFFFLKFQVITFKMMTTQQFDLKGKNPFYKKLHFLEVGGIRCLFIDTTSFTFYTHFIILIFRFLFYYGMDVPTLNTFLSPILTVASV